IKEATNCCSRVDDLYRSLPKDFTILSGNDNMTLPFMALGACGVISACSNVLVREMKQLVDLANAGKFPEARAIHTALIPKMRLLFEEPNPIVIKYVLASQRILRSAEVRLPLYVDAEERLEEIAAEFHH
ncbi:MAG: dihydrodipicolinate synthase family protein, partial [Opitutales bacterium]|nr:dihydrodipicolinate synthase family protein [Opitutales bacterium]